MTEQEYKKLKPRIRENKILMGSEKDTICESLEKQIVKTNSDKIRNMSDEELAEFLCESTTCEMCKVNFCSSMSNCFCKLLEWLQKEVEE